MLFNSPIFLFCYLPLVLAGFAIAARFGRQPVVVWLSAASLVFYGYWQPVFLILLSASIVLNYGVASLIWRYRSQQRTQRLWLIVGICANIGALCYFKYLFPFLRFLVETLGIHREISNVILPLGISFFTFTQIAYLIDLAQDAAEPQDFSSYVLFVTFFPHLIAGPILHHREIMPQFSKDRDFSIKWDDVALGLSWFVLGLCKKVLIADRLAPFAETAFSHPALLTASQSWLGLLNYSMQLYFDFSGYSDMAVGLARMFSIRLPLNFDSPYKAASIIEFWSRWHMTLTRYLTLYLYNPLAMWCNRRRSAAGKSISRKATRTFSGFRDLIAAPTIATMFVAGIWHGAGFQFLIFGTLHGVYLTVNHAWRIFRREGSLLTRAVSLRPISVALTFVAVLVGQVFFRASSTGAAIQFLSALCGQHGSGIAIPAATGGSTQLAASLAQPLFNLIAHGEHSWRVFLVLPIVWLFPNTQEILGIARTGEPLPLSIWQPNLAWATLLGVAFIAVFWYMTDTSTFLYFQF